MEKIHMDILSPSDINRPAGDCTIKDIKYYLICFINSQLINYGGGLDEIKITLPKDYINHLSFKKLIIEIMSMYSEAGWVIFEVGNELTFINNEDCDKNIVYKDIALLSPCDIFLGGGKNNSIIEYTIVMINYQLTELIETGIVNGLFNKPLLLDIIYYGGDIIKNTLVNNILSKYVLCGWHVEKLSEDNKSCTHQYLFSINEVNTNKYEHIDTGLSVLTVRDYHDMVVYSIIDEINDKFLEMPMVDENGIEINLGYSNININYIMINLEITFNSVGWDMLLENRDNENIIILKPKDLCFYRSL